MAHDIRNGHRIVNKWDDWALLDKGEEYTTARWILAHYPHYDNEGNITSWDYGHYFNNFFDAVHYVELEVTPCHESNEPDIDDDPEL